jgi:hypothetical protein
MDNASTLRGSMVLVDRSQRSKAEVGNEKRASRHLTPGWSAIGKLSLHLLVDEKSLMR